MASTNVLNTTIDRGRHTVLVVDDNPTTRYATARVIRAAGFQTVEADTGRGALLLAPQRVSAVVLDVHLPDINGFEVCHALRTDLATATLPVVHLSAAYIENEDKVAGLNAGADAYLVHPVEPTVLIATLQALIRARMAEDRLRGTEARFRAIYNHAPTGMALIDAQGRFDDVNAAMARLFGRPRDLLIGKAVASFAAPDEAARVMEETTMSLEASESRRTEFEFRKSDGSSMWLDWTLSGHIEPGLRVGIVVDVSERLELEQRQRDVLEREQAARADAERHSRTKDDFVAVLSHELRNPLTSIIGWVHLLGTRPSTPELLHKALTSIDRSVKAQARIISDILDVSRINSGKLHLHREWVDARGLVASSIETLRASITAKRLEVRFDENAADPPAWLDATRFQQIVWNLMTNAIKFSQEGGRIDVELERRGDLLMLSVRDFGHGIEADFLAHLFDRFTQSDSPDNRRHQGLGLGLAIVKDLAELHDGRVDAASAGLGQGAVLCVTLKVVAAEPNPSEPMDEAPAAAPAMLSENALSGLDVLVVEDNVDAGETLRVVLTSGGAVVRVATDAKAALAALEERWPTVLLSDIGLPGLDGYELIRRVRRIEQAEQRPELFAVALTAFARPQDQARALEAGFDEHIKKPLAPMHLTQVIAHRRRGA